MACLPMLTLSIAFPFSLQDRPDAESMFSKSGNHGPDEKSGPDWSFTIFLKNGERPVWPRFTL